MFARPSRKICSHVFLVVLLLLVLATGRPAGVRAAPAGGTFTVNSTADNTDKDPLLTLREALLAANGDLARPVSDGEKAQLAGCTFGGSSGSWSITNDCGAGWVDSILFSYTSGVISLDGALGVLPALSDSVATVISGPTDATQEIAIDGSDLPGGKDILSVTSDENVIRNSLAFRNGPRDGIFISGSHNQVKQIRLYGNNLYGVEIDGGDFNEINGNELGFRSLDNPSTCLDATRNLNSNILVYNGAESNTLIDNVSVCSLQYGILLSRTTTFSNTVQSNDTGVWNHGGFRLLGNAVAGIGVLAGSHDNQLLDNTVGGNQDGIVITGSDSNNNLIQNNLIGYSSPTSLPNTRYGLRIDAGMQGTQVLGNTIAYNLNTGVFVTGVLTSGAHLLQGNTIANNGAEGVVLSGSTVDTILQDNEIFLNASAGVSLKDASSDNKIMGGHIYQNGGAGISEAATAGKNWWSQLSTFSNAGLGIDRLANGTPDAPTPVITGLTPGSAGALVVSGTATTGATVELYQVAADPSGFGEGRLYINSTVTNSAGKWQVTVAAGGGKCFTAFETISTPDTKVGSEFGRNSTCIFLPFVVR